MLPWIVADQLTEVKEGYSGLLISCIIVVVAIVVGIWWLKRQS